MVQLGVNYKIKTQKYILAEAGAPSLTTKQKVSGVIQTWHQGINIQFWYLIFFKYSSVISPLKVFLSIKTQAFPFVDYLFQRLQTKSSQTGAGSPRTLNGV